MSEDKLPPEVFGQALELNLILQESRKHVSVVQDALLSALEKMGIRGKPEAAAIIRAASHLRPDLFR